MRTKTILFMMLAFAFSAIAVQAQPDTKALKKEIKKIEKRGIKS